MKIIREHNYLVEFLREGHAEILGKLDQLYRVLTRLHFEGKASVGRNILEIKTLLDYFHGPFARHCAVEETVIYPFLSTHIPRFESVISLLLNEHADIKSKLSHIRVLFDQLDQYRHTGRFGDWLDSIDSKVTYAVYLIRGHMQVETENIFKLAVTELHADELKELNAKIIAMLDAEANGNEKERDQGHYRKASGGN